MNNNLGDKIKKYRKRADMSQMELEVAIESSPGSISRIESGKVNPTKETLGIIAKVLKLEDYEVADLFDIKLDISEKLIQLINKFTSMESTEDAIISLVDDLYSMFNLHVGIFLNRKDNLYGEYNGSHYLSKYSMKVIGYGSFRNIKVSLGNEDNLLVKSFLGNQIVRSNSILDFGVGIAGKRLLGLVGKLIGYKSGVAIPIRNGNSMPRGIFFLVSTGNFNLEQEIGLLEAIVQQVDLTIRGIENTKPVNI